MTVRARIEAATGTALNGWTGTSRHWAATGDDLVIESLPSDAGTARLLVSRGDNRIAEAELRDHADEAFLALNGSVGRHPADAAVVAALVEAAFQRCPEAGRLRVPGLGNAASCAPWRRRLRVIRPRPTRSWSERPSTSSPCSG